ncbi:MAG TPA: VTT domain-containing protein [Candidatus Paceibacterota bacterium]
MSDLYFVTVVKDVVVNPSLGSVLPLFIFSFINDLIGIFPFALALAGQLAFLKEPFTFAFAMKLLLFVSVPVGIGSAAGSVPFYILTYYGGKPAVSKFQKFLRLSWSDVEKVSLYFRGSWYDEIIFLLLRCVPVLPSIPLDLAAGFLRMNFVSFFILTLVGSIIRMMITFLVVGMALQGIINV